MISTQSYLHFMSLQFTDKLVSLNEAVFQTVCSQLMFFSKLRSLFTSVYGFLPRVTFYLIKLNHCLKKLVSYFSRGGAEFDISFAINKDTLVITNNISIEEHQFIGEKIRLFMLETIIVSAGVKEKYGGEAKLYKLLRHLYTCLFDLRNSIVEKFNKRSIKQDELYYICPIKYIPNSFAYQRLIVKALTLEVDLPFYNKHLINASCLKDFP